MTWIDAIECTGLRPHEAAFNRERTQEDNAAYTTQGMCVHVVSVVPSSVLQGGYEREAGEGRRQAQQAKMDGGALFCGRRCFTRTHTTDTTGRSDALVSVYTRVVIGSPLLLLRTLQASRRRRVRWHKFPPITHLSTHTHTHTRTHMHTHSVKCHATQSIRRTHVEEDVKSLPRGRGMDTGVSVTVVCVRW